MAVNKLVRPALLALVSRVLVSRVLRVDLLATGLGVGGIKLRSVVEVVIRPVRPVNTTLRVRPRLSTVIGVSAWQALLQPLTVRFITPARLSY